MNRDDILKTYGLNSNALLAYGFTENDGVYTYRQDFETLGLYMMVEITPETFRANVYDTIMQEEYIPFRVKSSIGGFVGKTREKADTVIQDIISKCFESMDIKNKLFNYVREVYGVEPEYPWAKYPAYATFKTPKTKKWFGLIMTIPYTFLGLEKEGAVDVANVKCEPEKVCALVDCIQFFPAYHMNKKFWLTVILDKNIPFHKVTDLLDESYRLVEKP